MLLLILARLEKINWIICHKTYAIKGIITINAQWILFCFTSFNTQHHFTAKFASYIDSNFLVLAVYSPPLESLIVFVLFCFSLIKSKNIYFYLTPKIICIVIINYVSESTFLLKICLWALTDLLLGRKQQYRASPTQNVKIRGTLPWDDLNSSTPLDMIWFP